MKGTLIIPVPLIQAKGHDWILCFAFFANEPASILIYGQSYLATTSDKKRIRQLMANLKAIQEWIATTFKKAMEDWSIPEVEQFPHHM
ncbi:hypothetical protein F4860DRAFT_458132 [Xylaria cubensis]|nr:hypothetical protein F4860DRAFT_458132 [Xylaria cubensis]